MSRILVADDNSNIQKMVALALKEEGIDVVAVGNGEAAMRRIPDLRPDLVLADIFMPVRNGYEVCEFIKSDSRYMATPVVLLVGAFDPLDEQETQRVRADGVLKKPFVPPDPLINMVKALLAKSNGQKPMPVAAAPPAKPAPPPQTAPAPAAQPSPSSEVAAAPPVELAQRHADMNPSDLAKMLAFITPPAHTEPQTARADDPDEVVTAVRDPNLGEPFWATPAEPEEPQETEAKSKSESESESEPKDMIDMHSFGKDEPEIEEERESIFRPDPAFIAGGDSGADLEESPASQYQAARPQDTTGSEPMPASEYETNAVAGQSGNEAPSSSAALPETPDIFKFDPALTFPAPTQDAPIEKEADDAHSATFTEPMLQELPVNESAAAPSWPGVTDSTAQTCTTGEKPFHAHEQTEPLDMDLPPLPNHDAVLTAATQAARLAFSDLNIVPGLGASGEGSDRNASPVEPKSSVPASSAANATPANPEMIEAVVNRLLERMQPEIMEVVNREVLRPAIEAIVRREMKKS